MTCKHLTKTTVIVPGGSEVGGAVTPQGMPMTICAMRRNPGTIGWQTKCNDTPANGPCWFWIEENGTAPDPQFNAS